jgi:hypothetical protein
VKTGSTQTGALPSQTSRPTSAFTERLTAIILTVIKRVHGFAAMEQLTDGDRRLAGGAGSP